MTSPLPTFESVRDAAARVSRHLHRTPVLKSATADRRIGAEVFFKCENLQRVGAFKARGALNTVLLLDQPTAVLGVITHSSGNHGQALAFAAAVRGIPCHVVMPDDAPGVKADAVRGYGANVVVAPHVERETVAAALQQETGAAFVHPYNDPRVIAGQGTAAAELIEDVPDLDAIIAPIGGGGLLSGSALAASGLAVDAAIIGAEPAAADDAYRSLATGERAEAVPNPVTIADGLRTRIGEIPFAILSAAGAEILLVDEDEIAAAARFHLERMKLVVEPSGAVPLAALFRNAAAFVGKRVGVIISGGNTDLSWI